MFVIRENLKQNKNIVVINKRIIKKATERNLLKRRIKSVLADISKKEGKYFLLVVNSADLKGLDFKSLKKEIFNYLGLKL